MRLSPKLFATAAALVLASVMSVQPAIAASQPQSGGTLIIGFTESPRSLNGAVQSGVATALVSTQLFAGLVRYGDNFKPEPYLAKSWQWSDDHKSLTLHLRHDAVFDDGTPVTSADVAFSIMAVKKHTPFSSMFDAVEKVDTPDKHTAIIRLSHPDPALLIALSPALTPILPKHVYDKGNLETNPHNLHDVVGSGPFKLEKFIPGRELVLTRFNKFFLKGKPHLDRIVFQYTGNATTLLIGLRRGKIQMLPFVASPTILRLAKADRNLVLTAKGYQGIGAQAWIDINTVKKPFNNKLVRQAIAYTINKKFLTQTLLAGFAEPSYGPITPGSQFASPEAVHKYPYSLAKARKLLDEAGFKPGANGVRFKMTMNMLYGFPESKVIAQYMRTQLKKIGIDMDLRPSSDFAAWARSMATHDFDMSTDAVFNWGDPTIGVSRTYLCSNIRPVVWTNNTSYCNKEVDKLLHEAAQATSLAKRKSLYGKFEKIMTEDVPIIYLYKFPYHTLATKSVGNLPTGIWGVLGPMDDVYLKH